MMISSQKNFSNWKPNQVCHIGLNVVAEQKRIRAKTLLQQMLNLEKPIITTNMLSFFSNEYTLESLLDFITRYKYEEDENSLMYSYKATLILAKPSPCFERIISANLTAIICTLIHHGCKINANCHYQHLYEIFKSFQQKYTERFLQTLLNEKLLEVLLNPELFQKPGYFTFLYQLLSDFLSLDNRVDDELKEEVSSQIFIEFDFFNQISKFVCSHDEQITQSATDFLNLCLVESNFQSEFIDSFTDVSMKQLLQTITSDAPYETRYSCSVIVIEICKILKQKKYKFFGRNVILIPLESEFNQICTNLKNQYQNKPGREINFSAFKIEKNFSVLRLNMIKLVYLLIYHNAAVYETHKSFIIELFDTLINWFFEYRHNNIYHNLFYTLISLVIGDKEENILKPIFKEFNFMDRMIEVYIDKKGDHDNKGHILDICNLLRLTSKCMDENSFLYQFLKSNELWDSFQNLLITDTLIEINGTKESDIDVGSEYSQEKFSLFLEDIHQKIFPKNEKMEEDDLSVFEFK
eukprot:gene11624-4866_t